jgi:hypothetical protein
LLVVNGSEDLVQFALPEYPGGTMWHLLIDTNRNDDPNGQSFKTGDQFGVTSRSLLLFAFQPAES